MERARALAAAKLDFALVALGISAALYRTQKRGAKLTSRTQLSYPLSLPRHLPRPSLPMEASRVRGAHSFSRHVPAIAVSLPGAPGCSHQCRLLPTMVVSCRKVSRVCESPSSSTRRPRRHAAASSRRNCRKPGVPASSGRHCAANFCRASALSLIALAPTGARLPLGPGMNQKHWPGRTLSPEALAAHRCSSAPEQ